MVALLVVAAGCGALPGGDEKAPERTATLTAVPVTETETAATTPAVPRSVSLPPGVADDGTVDVDGLLDAHRRAVRESTYTWEYRQRQRSADTGEQLVALDRRVAVGENATLVETSGFPFVANSTRYLTERCGYLQRVLDIESPYSKLEVTHPNHTFAPAGELLRTYLVDEPYQVEAVTEGGEEYVRLHASTTDVPAAVTGDGTEVRGYQVTAYVTPAGFVRSMVVSFDSMAREGTDHRVVIRFNYAAVDETTVSRPEWVGQVWGESAGSGTPTDGDPTPTVETDC